MCTARRLIISKTVITLLFCHVSFDFKWKPTMQNCLFDIEVYNTCLLISELSVFSEEDIRTEYILARDMSSALVWSGDPVICNPFNSFLDCTSSVNWILIHFPQPAAVRIHEVVVPHDGGSFLGPHHKICFVTEFTQVVNIFFGSHIPEILHKTEKLCVKWPTCTMNTE